MKFIHRAERNMGPGILGPQGSLYLLLLIVAALLAGTGTTLRQMLFAGTDAMDSTLEFDSFSETSVAIAILKKHAKDLTLALMAHQESLYQFLGQSGGRRELSTLPTPTASTSAQLDPAWIRKRIDHWIDRYQKELTKSQAIWSEFRLESELLVLYKLNHRWEEFLDGYLRILANVPEHHAVTHWAEVALRHSGDLGRTEEILDALEHVAKFNRNPTVVERVRAVLQDWQKESSLQRSIAAK